VQIDCLVLDDGETSPKTPFLPAEESYAKRPTKLEPQVEPGVTTIDLARIKMRTAPRPSDRRYIVTYPSGDEQDVDFWRMADESYLYEVSCQLNPKATAGQIMSVREIKPDDPPFRERLASASYHRTVALWHQTQALWHRTHALSYPPGARILTPPIPPLHREPQPIPFADSHLPDVGLSFRDAQWTHEFAIDFADFVNFTFVYNMRGRRLELLRMRVRAFVIDFVGAERLTSRPSPTRISLSRTSRSRMTTSRTARIMCTSTPHGPFPTRPRKRTSFRTTTTRMGGSSKERNPPKYTRPDRKLRSQQRTRSTHRCQPRWEVHPPSKREGRRNLCLPHLTNRLRSLERSKPDLAKTLGS